MIDVVIPVYAGEAETRGCIESVLGAGVTVPHEVVVVDDATPEPPIARWLDELAATGRVTLLRNASNRGFVHSVNRGMALHADRDVVLLNSDTEVPPGWLDRLAIAAASDPKVASVTPFSNNATLCSYPHWGWEGAVPGTLGLAGLDALFARELAGRTLDLPTAVGFCMYIPRAALDALGAFDEERYGRGYGEENDFCMRAWKAGWRNVLAADVFVFHHGAISFSAEREQRVEEATRALLARHPEYTERVQAFIAADPARPLRAAVDLARARLGAPEAEHVVREREAEAVRVREDLNWARGQREILDAAVRELRAELDAVEQGAAARAAAYAECQREIERLRKGLAYAESLAFGRERELTRIRASLAYRIAARLGGVKAVAEPEGGRD